MKEHSLFDGGLIGVTDYCLRRHEQVDQGTCLDRYVEANATNSTKAQCFKCRQGLQLREWFAVDDPEAGVGFLPDHRTNVDPYALIGTVGEASLLIQQEFSPACESRTKTLLGILKQHTQFCDPFTIQELIAVLTTKESKAWDTVFQKKVHGVSGTLTKLKVRGIISSVEKTKGNFKDLIYQFHGSR